MEETTVKATRLGPQCRSEKIRRKKPEEEERKIV